MGTLSNNRGNAAQLGLWCVNANNAPSNANANNWGSRQSPQMRNDVSVIAPFDSINHPLKTLPVTARKGCVGQIGLTTAHKWSKYPAAHHATEMGGWRITSDGIYPSARVERRLLRLLKGDVKNLSHDGKVALASLYGYVKNGDSLTLKNLWRSKHADCAFSEK